MRILRLVQEQGLANDDLRFHAQIIINLFTFNLFGLNRNHFITLSLDEKLF